jgi:iron complex outermembrane receptor protein
VKMIDWLVGTFYTHEDTPTFDVYQAVNPTTLAVAGILTTDSYPTIYAEGAIFGNLDVHITDRFDVQFGGRESENRQRYEETYTGPIVAAFGLPGTIATNPPVHTQDKSFTYLVTPRFRFSEDLMAYARIASGYRPGGPNPTCILFPTPCEYKPDKTRNYELGLKGTTFNRSLSFDASVYYVDWSDIQLQAFNFVGGNITGVYFTNASRAKSDGVELSTEWKPLDGLTLAAWVALNDAVLKAALPAGPAVGNSGDPLPYASRFSGNVSILQTFPIAGNTTGFVGGAVSYVGDRKDVFETPRPDLPAYAQTNLRAGVRYDSWTATMFLNNLADRRGILQYPSVGDTAIGVQYIQPRTAGISIAKTF